MSGLHDRVRMLGEPLLPCLLALAVGAAALWLTGHDALQVYRLMAVEAFGGERRIAATLTAATPLILTGLAAAVAFRSGVFNVGVEGSLYLGGLAAAYVGFTLTNWPAPALITLALLLSALAGALWMLAPALAKSRLGVDEVVTTLMLNFIAIGLCAWLVNGPLLAPGSANSASPQIADAARLPLLLPPSSLNLGFVLALLLTLLYAIWCRHTALGFETELHGMNQRFARSVGFDVRGLVVKTLLLSGAVGGLVGGVHALGVVQRFVSGFSPGYGFTGIAVALLGRNSALGVLLAALLFGALSTSSTTIQLFSDIPLEITGIIQGAVMIFTTARLWRSRST